MHIKDQHSLESMLEAVDKILQFSGKIHSADEFNNNQLVFDACMMNFIVMGEMVVKLSDELKMNYSHIDWHRIKGFRNIVAHEYFGIDAEEVWQIIDNQLPSLKDDLRSILF